MLEKRLKNFQDPPSEFRGTPFWAWNSELEIPELLRQIRLFKEMGFGGFFMHSRVGLETEYLSPKWFDCIRACVSEAEKNGLQAWLYDEDRWPSGAAGGKVTKDDDFKMKGIYCECAGSRTEMHGGGNTLAFFRAEVDAEKRTAYRAVRLEENAEVTLKPGESLLRFYWENDKKTSWFNGETYLDTLNEKAVRKFIETTHEKYDREIGEKFGRTIPGIFCDEPCYSHFTENGLPWTPALPQAFQKAYHYDLLDHLPELFYYTENEVSHARWAYYNLLTSLFVNAFSRQIGQWCEKHHLSLTGHVLAEDSLVSQTACSGAVMRFYEFMQNPGIDLLTEHWNIFETTKQCVSAARQFGKKVRLTEIYGCTGWDFDFTGHKALGDWQYALGINSRCQHLAWYSMKGEAKRDFPASISFQSPWAKQYKHVEDYFSRIGAMLTGSSEIREILVIHPLESFWSVSLRHPEIIPEKRSAMDDDFEWLARTLLAENLDFDYGDEEILSRIGKTQGKTLHVGEASYRSVLIPALKTVRRSTLELLQAFAAQGGQVCYLGEPPDHVDARPSPEAQQIFRQFFTPVTRQNFTGRLAEVSRLVSLTASDGAEIHPLLFHFAEKEDFHTLFVCNFGKEFAAEKMSELPVCERNQEFPLVRAAVRMAFSGSVYELDPETGSVYAVDSEYRDGRYHFTTSFAPHASRLFLFTAQTLPGVLPPVPLREYRFLAKPDCSKLSFSLDEPNVFVLDHADYAVDGVEKGKNCLILQIDDELRRMLGSGARGEAMIQPWLRRQQGSSERKLRLFLRYRFVCDAVPEACTLVLENPELCQLKINGTPVEMRESGWWIDKALRKILLPEGILKPGENSLELSCIYSAEQSGLENIYLLGKFGVCQERITREPAALTIGDWCMQGLPCYSGNLTYRIPLPELPEERVFLSFPRWKGVALGVRINDQEETLLAWPPERVELTPYLKRGQENCVFVTVYNSRRNSFGPFYLKNMWPQWTGSKEFKRCETAEKQSVASGLLAEPVLETLVK